MKICCLQINGWNWRTSSSKDAWNIDLIQVQKYYEKQVMLRESHIGEGESKLRQLRR
jgi:hypothetical protein